MMEPVQMTNSWSTQPSLPCLQPPGYRLAAPLQPAADSFVTSLDAAFTRPDLQYPRGMQLPAQQLPPPLAHQPQQYRHPPAGVAHPYATHQPQDSTAQHSASTAAATYAAAAKPAVPRLNLSKHDGLGFGSTGGLDASASARSAASTASTGAGHLQQHRAAVTSRASYTQPQQAAAAAAAQQRGGAGGEDASTSVPWESGPITPAQALKRYREYLTNYEQSEILEYPQVYFVGRGVAQKVQGSPHLPKSNHGYDDERGDYECVLHDHISYRYEILGVLGKGSFGQVLKCHDFKTNTQLALKIIRNKKRFHHQALVEVKILDHLKANDGEDAHHIIHMQEYFYFRNHLCITFELLSVNLYEFIKHNNFAGLSLPLIRRFATQMLRALKYLRSLSIIHCDLKPENILLKHPNRSIIKIIDFGSSCFHDEKVYTYIQSRFYRSPEVILGLSYGAAIDMWSFGCILAELYTGYPLFPGESEQEQLLCIMEVMGLPPRTLLERASRTKMFFDQRLMPRIVPNSRGKTRTPSSKSLQAVLKCTDAAFLDLLERCLRWNPADRITPEAALQHAWIAEQASSSAAPRPSVGVGLGGSGASSSSGSRHDLAKAAHTSSWRKPDDAPAGTLPVLTWQQAAAAQQQQAAAAAAAAAHKAASSVGSMTPETSALALSYLQPGAQGQQQQQQQAPGHATDAAAGDASIYPRAGNGMVTARAMMAGASGGAGGAAAQMLMGQRAQQQPQQPPQQQAAASGGSGSGHAQHRPSAYSAASMASSSSGQGAPAVQMVTPRALLYDGYGFVPQQQPTQAAGASQQQPPQQQQPSAAAQQLPGRQHPQQQQQQPPQPPQQHIHRLPVSHATPPVAAAPGGLFPAGGWGASSGVRAGVVEGLVQPPPEQCFFPQLSRR